MAPRPHPGKELASHLSANDLRAINAQLVQANRVKEIRHRLDCTLKQAESVEHFLSEGN
jgi:hypothetical protein